MIFTGAFGLDALLLYKIEKRSSSIVGYLKTAQLEIRPIYHKTDDRIKCHVFLCMLAYYLMWNAKQRLEPLFEEDQVGQNKKYTFEHIIERLKSIRKDTVEIEKIATTIITECDEEQQTILNHLRVTIK